MQKWPLIVTIFIALTSLLFIFHFLRDFNSEDVRQTWSTISYEVKEMRVEQIYIAKSAAKPNATSQDIARNSTIKYPIRQKMGPCPDLYGKITVFVAVVTRSYET